MVKDDIDCDWSYQMPILIAVKESWKDVPIDLYLAEYITNLRMRPDIKEIDSVMFGQKNIMVVA